MQTYESNKYATVGLLWGGGKGERERERGGGGGGGKEVDVGRVINNTHIYVNEQKYALSKMPN